MGRMTITPRELEAFEQFNDPELTEKTNDDNPGSLGLLLEENVEKVRMRSLSILNIKGSIPGLNIFKLDS